MNYNYNANSAMSSANADNARLDSLMGLVEFSRVNFGGYPGNAPLPSRQAPTGSVQQSPFNNPYAYAQRVLQQGAPQMNASAESYCDDYDEKFIGVTNKNQLCKMRKKRRQERERQKNEMRKLRKELRIAPEMQANSSSLFSSFGGACLLDVRTDFQFFDNPLRFRKVAPLLPPKAYVIRPSEELTFRFNLPVDKIRMLSEDYSSTEGYNYSVILRISKFINNIDQYFDYVPTSLSLQVNSEPTRFDERTMGTYFEAPIDVSEVVKPINEIKLTSQLQEEITIILGVFLVQMFTVEKAIDCFKREFKYRLIPNEREAERQRPMRMSLKCAISKIRMKIPCVGIHCTHYECFDLEWFVKSHHEHFQWKCPICMKRMKSVVKDKVFSRIIETVSPTCTEVMYSKSDLRVVEITHETEQLQQMQQMPQIGPAFSTPSIPEQQVQRLPKIETTYSAPSRQEQVLQRMPTEPPHLACSRVEQRTERKPIFESTYSPPSRQENRYSSSIIEDVYIEPI